jgi:LAO/AO transport system kinase
MKAGLLEAADVFVVNKADRPGAPALMAELTFTAHLQHTGSTGPRDVDWEVPVLAAQAQSDVGIAELLAEVRRHRAALESAGALAARRAARRRAELRALLVEEFTAVLEGKLRSGELKRTFDDVAEGVVDPYSAAEAILRRGDLLSSP